MRQDSYILSINMYFAILRTNSNANNYQEMPDSYRKCIRIVLCDYAPRGGFSLRDNPIIESVMDDGLSG